MQTGLKTIKKNLCLTVFQKQDMIASQREGEKNESCLQQRFR